MAAASAAVLSSSAFFPLSSPKFSPHFHPRAALPRGEFLGCGARLRPPGPHFRRRRGIQSRFPRFLVRALYDGRSVLLALAAAAANFALLRLLYQNYSALRKKSKQLSGYTESGVQESVTSPKQASDITQKGETENEIEELRYSHTLAPEFDANTDIRKNETVTLIDLTNGVATTTDAMTASSACVMLEESIVRTQTPERDMHECILGRKSEAVSVAVEVTRRTAEPSPMSTHVENRDTERVQDEGFYHDVADNQQSSYGTEDNAQRENLLTFDTITPSALVFSAALEGTRPESIREDSSLASAFNKVGVSSRIKRPVNGRSFIKEKTFNRNIDNKVTPLPNGTHVRRKSDPSEYLKTYNCFLRDGRLTDCVELLENAEKNGFLDMDKVYHVRFLNSCKSQKAVKEAFRFIKLIRNPTMSTFNMLLSVCANSQDFEGAFQVLLLVKEADLKADCKLYTTLISTCAKSGKVDAMFEIFHEMVNAGVEPNVHTYGALIDGCARAGQVAKAFGAYGIMSSKKVKPDRVIFNALITACGQSGAVDRAFDVLAEMGAEPTPIEPDHVTVGALIKTCVQAGQVDRAREVYKLMHQYNIRGTPEVYTIAVNSCSETGDLEFALSVYNDMKRNGVIPDEMFLSALIDAAGHAGKVNVAFEILQKARNQGVKLGNISYSSLMGACCNSKNWQKALELYEDIKAIKLLPTVSTVNALITSLCEADQLQKSVEVLAEVKEAGVVLNAITYSVLLVACERNDDVELGFKLFSEAKMDGFIPNVIMCRCLTGLCLRRFEKAYSCGEPIFSFSSGKFELDNKWTSLALLIYRETIGAGDVPSMEIFSQVLGCLKLPHDASLRNTLVENLGVSNEASKRFNTYSLLDGFGEYDPRSFSLFEEAASLGVVPCATFKESPIVIDTRKLEVRISEVYLITVLKGLKHRLAAGARLPNIIILLYTEKTQLTSPRGDRTVALAGRVGQAICAMLRRMGLPYQGKESYGKIRINGLSLRRWFQPKLTSSESKPAEPSLLRTSLARGIIDQQRDIRTSNLSID